MLRSAVNRSLARSLLHQPARAAAASTPHARALSSIGRTVRSPVVYRPTTLALVRHSSSTRSKEDQERQERLAHEKLKPMPELVSTESTVMSARDPAPAEEDDTDMMAGIRSDLNTIRETFTLNAVPREALAVGLAGVVPYLATSLSTVFLAFNMNWAAHHGTALVFDEKTAEFLLRVIEPLQIGYGAVIISFLGAIHWGLEWAKFGGDFGYKRYWVGVLAPAIAWPTTMMPVEYALITQFLAFNWLYFTDSNAAKSGMAPNWYGIYRFVLTFIVGSSIVATLVGRGQITEMIGHPSSAMSKVQELRQERDRYLAQEEEEKEELEAHGGEVAKESEEGQEEDDEE